MKVYTIKNKEGKYLDDYQNIEANSICDALLIDTKKEALKFCPKDCKVVEITIAEIDNPKRENNETIKYVETSEPDKVAGYIDNLNQQLAEKDKEIEELKTRILELKDKDWYEACIKQLEEQNDKLIKERDALQYKVSNERINSIPEPKFDIGSTVIAKTINRTVVIEGRYYDKDSNKWLYQFHAPSSVMDDDYYPTYGEDYLDEIDKGD